MREHRDLPGLLAGSDQCPGAVYFVARSLGGLLQNVVVNGDIIITFTTKNSGSSIFSYGRIE